MNARQKELSTLIRLAQDQEKAVSRIYDMVRRYFEMERAAGTTAEKEQL